MPNFIAALVLFGFSLWMSEAKDECLLSHEVVLLQDATNSYHQSLLNLESAMSQLFETFERDYIGIKFGVVTFKDSPHCGWREEATRDYCAHVHQSLDSPGARDMEASRAAFRDVVVGGGKDSQESFVDAIVRVALSDKVGWSTGQYDDKGQEVVRLLIATTDFLSHTRGDAENCYGPFESPMIDTETRLMDIKEELNDDINARCDTLDYTDWDEVRKALAERNIRLVLLMARMSESIGGMETLMTAGINKVYMDVTGNDIRDDANEKYRDPHFDTALAEFTVDYLLPPAGLENTIVYSIDKNMTSFIPRVLDALGAIHSKLCPTTTTTTTTTTTATTTSTTTTTTTTVTTTTTTDPTTSTTTTTDITTTTTSTDTTATTTLATATTTTTTTTTITTTTTSITDTTTSTTTATATSVEEATKSLVAPITASVMTTTPIELTRNEEKHTGEVETLTEQEATDEIEETDSSEKTVEGEDSDGDDTEDDFEKEFEEDKTAVVEPLEDCDDKEEEGGKKCCHGACETSVNIVINIEESDCRLRGRCRGREGQRKTPVMYAHL